MRRRAWIFLLLVAAAAATAGGLISVSENRAEAACPPAYMATTLGRDPDSGANLAGKSAAAADKRDTHARLVCLNRVHPESYADFSRAASLGAAHDATTPGGLRYGAHAAAVEQAARMAGTQTLPGSGGTWSPVGSGPLIANDPTYPRTAGEGFTNLSGRINGFAYDPSHGVIYATVGQGGVWETRDRGANWTAIGDKLPSQPVGSVAYSPADGGTVIVVTGNDVFGGGTGSYGMGVWYTRDDGATWTKSQGVPDDALGFKAAVDPAHPNIVYAATGAGLYRSTDAGATFANVDLPTGYTNGDASQPPLSPNCTGQFKAPKCFLANMVTDVVVQGAANSQTPSAKPGAVVAVVGWRAGNKTNPNGNYVESPNNGIYVSDTGAPGSFKKVDTSSSLGDPSQVGRVELGSATGATQNHNVLYAEVADAQAFQNGEDFGLDSPISPPTGSNTMLRGIYVSTDWGKTWSQLASATQLDLDPTTGSSLTGVGCTAQFYCPGVQAWYNEWILPDPTRTDANGVPARLLFGLEEIWSNDSSTPAPLDGSTPVHFKVVGRYFGSSACQFLNTGLPVCPTNGSDQSATTLHPDQHAAIFVPDSSGGGVTVFAGSDGGAYSQHTDSGGELTSGGWGPGIQNGFHTLMPYDAAVSKDGTVVAGLQDNGTEKISPSGKQNEIFDGDGFYSAIDPNNSKTMYEEYVDGQMNVSTDGGSNWTEIHASDPGAQFAMPFQMDPTDANHLIAGGGTDPNMTSGDENVEETTNGPNTTEPGTGPSFSTDWVNVFDIGSTNGIQNSITAVTTLGNASYAGYCGACQVLTETPFANGLATNVGGPQPGAKASTSGWHKASAIGLPERLIQGISIDPNDAKTVYVALADYSRRWTPAGVLGEDTSKIGTGHIFVSHDAGQHFTDISANLPDAPANDVIVRNGQLIAATDVGVFISSPLGSGPVTWQAIGTGLPAGLQVLTLQLRPGDANKLIVATHGRGVWEYDFPAAGGGTGGGNGGGTGGGFGSGGGTFHHGGPKCPAPSGRLSGARVGPLALGEHRSSARHAMKRFKITNYGFDDFCLRAGWGIRVGYPTQRLVRSLSRGLRRHIAGEIVIALTANRHYALDGVKPGARLSTVARRLGIRGQSPVRLGPNAWYLVHGKGADGVVKVRHGVIQEVGLVDKRLVGSRRAWVRFLRSFRTI